jgi:hypothetical protein
MSKTQKIIKQCLVCQTSFHPKWKTTGKYCSIACWQKVKPSMRGKTHPSWKGGHYTTSGGYIRIHLGGGKQILEHRLVMEQMIGRPMLATETVHHKNGIRNDNRPENLELRVGQHGKGATVHCPTCKCEVN